ARRSGVGLDDEVLPHRQPPEDPPTLGDEADPPPGPDVGGGAGDGPALEPDLAAGGVDEPGDRFEQCGLACTIGPEEDHGGIRRHYEIDGPDRVGAPVSSLEPPQLEE